MKYKINGQDYLLNFNPIKDTNTRQEYFALTKKTFGLDFSIWYDSGFWSDQFTPYTLFDQDHAVASVGVCVSDIEWNGQLRTFAQISTVMTDPEYRNKGLNRWLLDLAINEWTDKSDCIYLYANDTVVDYYPKFGFIRSAEYRYKKEFGHKVGSFRRLDLESKSDLDLLIQRYSSSNPFSALRMKHHVELLMFHCLTFLKDNIYYIEQYDAVVIAEYEDDMILCYDIFTDCQCDIEDILGILINNAKQMVVLGFTPKVKADFSVAEVKEKDYHVFVLKDNDELFTKNKIALPLLSHA